MKLVLDTFFDELGRAEQCALLLDYDGTLAPFQVDRSKAVPYPGIRQALERIITLQNTYVVVITGRGINDILPLLELSQLPEIWGSHGWERLTPEGTYEIAPLDGRAKAGLDRALQEVQNIGLSDRCEQKPVSLAIHWRGLPSQEGVSIHRQIMQKWSPIAKQASLELHSFDGGIELRVPGRDKGYAVKTIISKLDRDVVAAYLGDDLTDEDAFNAIKGVGLGVLVRPEYRPTSASIWLKPPDELLDFLRRWHQSREQSIS